MAHLELSQYVVPFPVPSTLAASFLAEDLRWRADLIHIDAAHEYEDVQQDIKVGGRGHWRPGPGFAVARSNACCWQLLAHAEPISW